MVASIVVTLATVYTTSAQGPDAPASISVRASDSTLFPELVELWRAGGFLGIHRNVYSADEIEGLPELPNCCPSYTSGGGFGIVIGLTAGVPIDQKQKWALHWRAAFSTYSGTLRTEELEVVNVGSGNNSDSSRIALATFEHTIEAQLQALSLESFISFRAYPRLFFSAGLRGDFLIKQWFHQKEFLASPEGVTFENGTRTRFEYEGEIPGSNTLQGAIVANIRYEFPLNPDKNIVFAPELSGWYALTNIVENLPWGAHGIRIGASLQYIHYDKDLIVEERDKFEEKMLEDPEAPIRSGPLVPRATEEEEMTGGKEEEESEKKPE